MEKTFLILLTIGTTVADSCLGMCTDDTPCIGGECVAACYNKNECCKAGADITRCGAVATCVCAFDSVCCDTYWDGTCVDHTRLCGNNICKEESLGVDSRFFTEWRTFEEIMAHMEVFVTLYPTKAQIEMIGDQPLLKLTSGKDNMPIWWLQAGQHASEWIGVSTALYLGDYLFFGELLEQADVYIYPVFSKAAYKATWNQSLPQPPFFPNYVVSAEPECLSPGGRFERLIEKTNSNGNWPYKFGQSMGGPPPGAPPPPPCLNGGNPSPGNVFFFGDAALSITEVRLAYEYLLTIKDRLEIFIDFHSYGQVMLYSPTWTLDKLPNSEIVAAAAADAAARIKNVSGKTYFAFQASNLEGPAGGTVLDSITYLRGEDDLINFVFAFELRGERGRFNPTANPGPYWEGFVLASTEILATGREIAAGFGAIADAAIGIR